MCFKFNIHTITAMCGVWPKGKKLQKGAFTMSVHPMLDCTEEISALLEPSASLPTLWPLR